MLEQFKPGYITGGLVLDLHLESMNGDQIVDSSMNGNHGTVTGAIITDGKKGRGLEFDGISNFATIPISTSFTNNEITVSLWVKPKAGSGMIITGATDTNFIRTFNNYFQASLFPGNQIFLSSLSEYTIDQWYHLAITYDGSSAKFYVNGVLNDKFYGLNNNLTLDSGEWKLGMWKPADPRYFGCTLDDIKIYSKALSESDIKYNYLGVITVPMFDLNKIKKVNTKFKSLYVSEDLILHLPMDKISNYESGSELLEVAPQLDENTSINTLESGSKYLYAGTDSGEVIRWNGSDEWINVGNLYPKVVSDGLQMHLPMEKINDDETGLAWTEVAPQLDSNRIISTVEHDGSVYGGTDDGKILRWNGSDAWVIAAEIPSIVQDGLVMHLPMDGVKQIETGKTFREVAPQLGTSTDIISTTEHDGEIYGSTKDGKIFKWNGVDAWIDTGNFLEFGPELTVNGDVETGLTTNWAKTETPSGVGILTVNDITPISGKFDISFQVISFTSTYPQCRFTFTNMVVGRRYLLSFKTRRNGTTWQGAVSIRENSESGEFSMSSQTIYYSETINTYSFSFIAGSTSAWIRFTSLGDISTFYIDDVSVKEILPLDSLLTKDSDLYGASSSSGKLFKWNTPNQWIEKSGTLNSQTDIYTMCEFKNKLYGGTGLDARLFEWDGISTWVQVAGTVTSQTRIISLTEFKNELYGSTREGKLLKWNGTDAWVDTGNFMELGPDLLAGWSFQDGTWNAIGNSPSIINANAFSTAKDNGGVRKANALIIGKRYRVSFAGTTTATLFGASDIISGSAAYIGTGGGTFDFTATTVHFYMRHEGIGTTTITSLTLREILPFDNLLTKDSELYGASSSSGKLFKWNDPNQWIEKAPQLGDETYIRSLVVFNGKLYCSTSPNGKLYEWNGINAWIEVAPKLGTESEIYSLVVFNGKIYGGTGQNSKLYEWNGTDAWVEVAPKLGTENRIWSLVVFNSEIYGGTDQNGKLYKWNGTNAWIEVAPKLGDETWIFSLAVFNNKIYGGTGQNGKLYEWNGTDAWVEVADRFGSETQIRSLAVYNNKLYGGTYNGGRLLEWNGTDEWIEVAPKLGDQSYIMSLVVFNGKLYGGTGGGGRLFEWNGTNAWVEVSPRLGTEIHIYSLTIFNGKLYGGTFDGGKLLEWSGSDLGTWTAIAPTLNNQNITKLKTFNSKIYAGTSPLGNLQEFNGTNAWVQKAAQLDSQTSILALEEHDSELYGSTSPANGLFKWNGSDAWVDTAAVGNLGADILAGWNFTSGWTTTTGSTTIDDASTFTASASGHGVYSSAFLTVGKRYRLSVAGTASAGTYIVRNGFASDSPLLITGDGTVDFTSTATQIRIAASGGFAATVTITQLTVHEVFPINSLLTNNLALYGASLSSGKLFQFNGTDAWSEVADEKNSQTRITALSNFNTKLYAGTGPGARLFEWTGSDLGTWTAIAETLNNQNITKLISFNSLIHAGTSPLGNLQEFNGTAWVSRAAQLNSQTQILDLEELSGVLYGSTGHTTDGGRLFQYNGSDAWVQKAGKFGTINRVTALKAHNSSLYGVSAFGDLLEYNGSDAWVSKADPELGADLLAGWTFLTGWNVSSGAVVTIDNATTFTTTAIGGVLRGLSLVVGRRYRISILGESTTTFTIRDDGSAVIYKTNFGSADFTAVSAGIYIRHGGAGTTTITSLSLQEITSTTQTLESFQSKLYSGDLGTGKLFEWNGSDAWVQKAAQLNSQTSIYSLLLHQLYLYGSTGPNGRLFEYPSSVFVSRVPDISLNNNNGIVYGATAVPGKRGSALSFDGVDDYVETNAKITTSAWTVSAWVKIIDNTTAFLLNQWVVSHIARLVMVINTSGKLELRVGNETKTFAHQLDTWYFITMTRDASGNVTCYINNTSIGTAVNSNALPDVTIQIGGTDRVGSRYSKSIIDEPIVYNRALTPAEISQNYYATREYHTNNILENWDFTSWNANNSDINNSNTFTTNNAFSGGVSKNSVLVPGKRYKLSITGSKDRDSTFNIMDSTGTGNVVYTTTALTFSGVVEFVVHSESDSNLSLYCSDNPLTTVVITALELEEIPQRNSLESHNSSIFSGSEQVGKLFKFNVTDPFIHGVAEEINSQKVHSLKSFNGNLYAGTSPDGNLQQFNESDEWLQKAPELESQSEILALEEHDSELYGSTGDSVSGGRLFQYNGSDAWVQKANKFMDSDEIVSMRSYNGVLYGATNTGRLYKWNGSDSWVEAISTLYGPNSIINGEFLTDTDWTKSFDVTGWRILNGKAYSNSSGASGTRNIQQNISARLNVPYKVSYTVEAQPTITDTSEFGRTGRVYGAQVETVSGKTGLSFNGLQNYIDTGADYIGTGAFTISGWIRPESYGGNNLGRVMDNGNTSLIVPISSSRLRFSSNNHINIAYSSDNSISLGSWTHIAVTRTAAGATNFYINGILSGTANQNSGTPVAGTTNLIIGNRTTLDRGFDGILKDIEIRNYVVTPEQATDLFNGVPLPDDGLGPELVTNGDFSSSVGWTVSSGWQISEGTANCTSDGTLGTRTLDQNNIMVARRPYRIIFDIVSRVSGSVLVQAGGSSNNSPYYSSTGTKLMDATAVGQGSLRFWAHDSVGFTGSIDDVSVKERLTKVLGYSMDSLSFVMSGSVRANIGAYAFGSYRSEPGDYTDILTPVNPASDTNFYMNTNDSNGFTGVIDNVSVHPIHSLRSLETYRDKLLAGSLESGSLYEFNGSDAWLEKATQVNSQNSITSLVEAGNYFYGSTDPNGKLLKFVYGPLTYDISEHGRHGTIAGVVLTPGKKGNALSFDGVDDFIDTGSDVIGTGPFTASGWIYVRGAGGGGLGRLFQATGGVNCYVTTSNRLRILRNEGFGEAVTLINFWTENTWVHFTITDDGAGNARFYRNSIDHTNIGTTSIPIASTSNLIIGNRASGGRGFYGYIDEFTIYNRVLTQDEIKQNYYATQVPVTANLLDNWSFTDNWTNLNSVISDTNTFVTTSSNGSVYKTGLIEANKRYRINVHGSSSSGHIQVGYGSSPGTNIVLTGSGIVDFVTDSNVLRIECPEAESTVTVTHIELYEVVPISAIKMFNSNLYAVSNGSGRLFEVNETEKTLDTVAPFLDSQLVTSPVVHENNLYSGTKGAGRLFQWNGSDAWVSKAPQFGTDTEILSTVSFNGEIYGSTSTGKLLRWNGSDAWVDTAAVGNLGAESTTNGNVETGTISQWAATNHNGSTSELTANDILPINGIYDLKAVITQVGSYPLLHLRIMGLTVGKSYILSAKLRSSNNRTLRVSIRGGTESGDYSLFASTLGDIEIDTTTKLISVSFVSVSVNGYIRFTNLSASDTYYFDDVSIKELLPLDSLLVHDSELYGASSSSGKLFKFNGTDTWTEVADTLSSQNIHSLSTFRNKIYAGTGENGRLLEWNGSDAWILANDSLNSQTHLKSLGIYENKLYAGTSPNGRLFSYPNPLYTPKTIDISNNQNNGTVTCGTIVDGINNKAIRFDGISDRITIPNNSDFQMTANSPHTISYWMKLEVEFNGASGLYTTIMKGAFSSSYGHLISRPNRQIRIYTNGSTATLSITNFFEVSDSNTWVHVTETYDGDKIRVYKNGEFNSESESGITLNTNTNSLYIGSTLSTYYFPGAIDEVMIYKKALTDTEVKKNYLSSLK